METDKIIDAAKYLCTVWKTVAKDMEKTDITNDVYSSMCETDEAIALLAEKVGDFAKAMTIAKVYGNVELTNSHQQTLSQIQL
jgi:hypothetical protein